LVKLLNNKFMLEKIISLLIQFGVGSLVGVIIGLLFQYLISKKLKVFETKLTIFRRVYKQLYYFVLMNQNEIDSLTEKSNYGINAMKAATESGLNLKNDLGDILYYVDGDLEKKVSDLIYNLYLDGAIFNKKDIDNILYVMNKLKKFK